MRHSGWLFWLCYFTTGFLVGYTLMIMYNGTLAEQAWLLLAAWMLMSSFQWFMFLMNITYRRVVR